MDKIIIGGNETCWVFVSDSNEVRHIYDIIFAVSALSSKGVNSNAIKIFTDQPFADLYTQIFSCPPVIALNQLSVELSRLVNFSHIIVVVTGHGRLDGVGEQRTKIQPNLLLNAVRSIPNLSCGAIILCQCFAGVFNFLDAASRPPVAIMGATNLTLSLSPPINLAAPIIGANGISITGWNANAFMFYLFKWILNPLDIDGDGCISLIDAYKYAGAESTSQISSIKTQVFIEAQRLAIQILPYNIKEEAGILSPDERLKLNALNQMLKQHLSILNVNQEPWLLHANLARNIIFA